jgi:hypothetical protein
MQPTTHARLPLTMLEAVRDRDMPEDLEAELVPELRNKRFGLSDTVYTQIHRYKEAERRGQRVSHDEALGIARLLGRRQDAEAIFRAAGRRIAQQSYAETSEYKRNLARVFPNILGRPIALSLARKMAKRYFSGEVKRAGGGVVLYVSNSPTVDGALNSVGCTYYESALRELFDLLGVGGGSIEHVRCSQRSEGACEWRADWGAGKTPEPRSPNP